MYRLIDEFGAELGIRVTCQKCGKQIFRKQIKIDEFESMPKGWKKNLYSHNYGWWCPDCVKEYTV